MSRYLKFILGALLILVVPAIAELLNAPGIDWNSTDYVAAAVLLVMFGAAVAFFTGANTTAKKIAGGILVLLVLALYAHLAVGIVDTWPLAGS